MNTFQPGDVVYLKSGLVVGAAPMTVIESTETEGKSTMYKCMMQGADNAFSVLDLPDFSLLLHSAKKARK